MRMTMRVVTAVEATPKKRKFNLVKSRLPALILVIVLIYIAICLGSQVTRLWAMHTALDEVEGRVVELREKNEALWDRLTVLESEGYVEDTARERLGLVRPGETRIITVPADEGGLIDTTITD